VLPGTLCHRRLNNETPIEEAGMNMLKCSTLSAAIVSLATGSAAAAPALVLDYLNLRVGPGYEYGIIEVIPAGWVIDAGGCVDGWCQVNVNGIPGYVDANYLGLARPPAIAYGAPPYYRSYGPYYGPYADWAYPYRDYSTPRFDLRYGYLDDLPYSDAFAYAPAEGAGMRANGKPIDPVKRPVVAKNKAASTSHVAGIPTRSVATGAAPQHSKRLDPQ
jgi:uncharacterized protein YraI